MGGEGMMKMNFFAVAVALAVAAPSAVAQAPGGPPAGFFPAGMPNVGDLWIKFCDAEGGQCEQKEAKVWGQVCESGIADVVVNGPATSKEGYKMGGHMETPPDKHFVGWRCGEHGDLITPDRKGFYSAGKFVDFNDKKALAKAWSLSPAKP